MSSKPAPFKNILKVKITLNSSNQNKIFDFQTDLIRIGRNIDNDIAIDDSKVSRYHIELAVGSEHVFLRKVTDKNYILLNGNEFEEGIIRSPSKVELGESELIIEFINSALLPTNINKDNQVIAKVDRQIKNPDTKLDLQNQNLIAKNNHLGFKNEFLSQTLKEAPQFSIPDHLPEAKKKSPIIYFAIGIIAVTALYFLFSDKPSSTKKSAKPLRSSIITQQEIDASQKSIDEYTLQKEQQGTNTIGYKKAQEQFLKGFRDYRSGNYVRALENFAAARAFYPNHAGATRYLKLSMRKQEEYVQYHFNLGKRYLGVQNYRLCIAHFKIVLTSIKEENNPLRMESAQKIKECETKMEGRF